MKKTLLIGLQVIALTFASSAWGDEQTIAAELAELKAAKPYTLEIRYGSFAGNQVPDFNTLPADFLEQAESLQVGVKVPETGFAGAGPLTFAFKLAPHEKPGTYILEYVSKLRKTDGQKTLKSVLQIKPGEWIPIGSMMNTMIQQGQQVNQNFLMALRLTPSVP